MNSPTSFIRKLLELRLFLVINLMVLFWLSLSFGREYLRNASIEREILDLQAEQAALTSRNLEILSLSQSVQTQYFLEGEGRLKYGLRQPGEQLVVVTDEQTAGPGEEVGNGELGTGNGEPAFAKASAGRQGTGPVGNPERWWMYFFDRAGYQALKDSYGS